MQAWLDGAGSAGAPMPERIDPGSPLRARRDGGAWARGCAAKTVIRALRRVWRRVRGRFAGPRSDGDSGNAIVEFVFLGLILLLPLVYVLLAVFYVQRNVYGVTEAAREVGRAYVTTGEPEAARYAARLAMQDQSAPDGDLQIGWTGPQGDCADAQDGLPQLARGEVFAVCVTRHITIPGVPSFVGARHNTVTGRFVVHVDEYRDFG